MKPYQHVQLEPNGVPASGKLLHFDFCLNKCKISKATNIRTLQSQKLVVTIERHHGNRNCARAGEIVGIAIRTNARFTTIRRGAVLCAPNLSGPKISMIFVCFLFIQ